MILHSTPIFNPQGIDDKINRQVWRGNTTNLMNLNNVKYLWAWQLYEQMRENFWIPQKYDITQDVVDYKNLTIEERKAFNGILSYLTFLDSVQTCNIPHLKSPITAPEISLCMAEQISQEGMHNHTYQYMIETIVPSEERDDVYDFWRTDKVLCDRCEYIAQYYQSYVDDQTEENYFVALLADYLLEGLYFYNGFNFFYTLASRQLMGGSADLFKTINRDELSHVRLYQKLLPEAMEIFPYSEEQIYEMFNTAVQQECLWSNHIIGDKFLGITETSTENYTKYLANIRLKAIGLDALYPEFTKNPYAHLEKIADAGKGGDSKGNFFEAGVTSYNQSSAVEGWNEF